MWLKSFYWSKLLFNDGVQLYLIFQPLYYTLGRLGDTQKVVSWKSEGLWTEKPTTSTAVYNSLSLLITWYENSNFC